MRWHPATVLQSQRGINRGRRKVSLSYTISGLLLASAILAQLWIINRYGNGAFRPTGMDLLAKSFLDLLPAKSAPFAASFIWLIVSGVTDIVCPALTGRTDVLNSGI